MTLPHLTDLLELESGERAIMLALLRRGSSTREDLSETIEQNKSGVRIDEPELENALARLIERGWLAHEEHRGKTLYHLQIGRRNLRSMGEANLQRKVGLQSIVSTHGLFEAVEESELSARTAKPNAGQILFYLLALAILNALVLGILDVVAVSGFVETLNTQNLPWLWIVDMSAGLLFSGFYLRSIDRMARTRLVNLLLGILGALYLIFGGMFWLGVSTRITFPLLYLIYAQQVVIFPVAFWNLANDLYSLVEARRIFPWLASGEMIGRLVGYAIFSLPGLFGLAQIESSLASAQMQLLFFSAGLFALGLTYSLFLFRQAPAAETRSQQPAQSLRTSLGEAVDMIRAVPLFRNLAISSTLEWTAITILWYLFYQALDQNSAQTGGFALGYSLFNIAYLLVPLLMQWRLTGYLLKRTAPRDVPLGLPIVLLISVVIGLILHNGIGTVLAIFLPMVVYNAWDLPSLHALQNLVPEERRGRVRALLTNYSYALGVILGSVLIALLTFIDARLGHSANDLFRWFALILAFFAAVGAMASSLQARATYEQSLLSWRLTRRQRKSDVLEKLEF